MKQIQTRFKMGNWSEWLSTFTAGTRALLPFARSAVSEGIGRTEFYNITRRAGIGAKKTDVLRMMRDLQAAFKDPTLYLDSSDLTSKPVEELIPVSLGRQARTYSYTVSVMRENAATGETWKDFTTIGSSVLLDVGDVYGDAVQDFDRYELPDTPNLATLRIESINKSLDPIFTT